MKFKKVHWFYITEINGEEYAVQRKTATSKIWQCTRDNWIYTGKTRKEAVLNAMNENRKAL